MVQTATHSRSRSQTPGIEIEHSIDPRRIPELVALENRCFQSIYRPHRFDAGDFEYYFGNPSTISLVATVDSVIVGYVLGIVGSASRRHLARIHSIAVDRSYRGCGIGAQLTKEFVRHARRRGCRIIHTEVAASANPGHQMFTKLGFRPYRRLPDYYGKGIDAVRFRLTLEE